VDAVSHPTVQEIAALTARLRELSDAGRDADPAEVDRFLADKRELLDVIEADDLPEPASGYTRSPAQAMRELADEGRHDAEALVGAYLAEVSAQAGTAANGWGLDDADMAEIRATDTAVQQAHTTVTDCLARAEPSAEAAHVAEEPAAADEAGFW
jgi:hypothetical protein